MQNNQNIKPEKEIKVFTLLSGGVDSTTTLAIALKDFPDASFEAISVDYGQRHKKEIECAKEIVSLFNMDYFHRPQYDYYEDRITHHIINLQGMMTGMLVDKGDENESIPEKSYSELPDGISPTYVSFRNGLMLSILAARAQSWVMQSEKNNPNKSYEAYVYIGVHADDGANWAYPDCTPEFIGGMANAIHIGTYFKVRVRAPLQYLDKAGVIREGTRLKVPYEYTWSCYKGEDVQCGKCPTCLSRRQAFVDLKLDDPTKYAEDAPILDYSDDSEIPF